MRKTNSGNYFEDFTIGSTIRHALPRTLTEGDNALYIGLTGRRYPLIALPNLQNNWAFSEN